MLIFPPLTFIPFNALCASLKPNKAPGLPRRYRPDIAPSLNKVAFQIRSGEKVGIVGRTGPHQNGCLSDEPVVFRLVVVE